MSFLYVNLRFFLADGELLSMEELMAFLESQSIRRPQMTTKHASTVLPCFREAVSAYGLPSRVCSEKGLGGERRCSNLYAYYTHIQRGPGRGSMITGTEY